ncbi:reverse transcriptase-like protein [Candidatus Peregrinibacteria bacterium]|nr:reverse transcriptase-like protein [Candidatus Peregrinibacteria bacterium]
MNKIIAIYTDGSCLGNPGPGGWGIIILYKGKEIKISGREKETTNNRMEMTAIIEALRWLHDKSNLSREELRNFKIKIYSDSNLLVKTLNQGWKRKANLDLWSEIDKFRAWLDIEWIWVKAHDTDKYNNMVDALAFNEAKEQKKELS